VSERGGSDGPGCIGLFLIVGMIGLVVSGIGDLFSGDEEDEANRGFGDRQEQTGPSASELKIGAQVVCEDEVRSQLKSPESAEFSEVEVAKIRGSKYGVRGAVDSENSFGANLRAFWVCDAEHIRGDQYRVSATVLE
jgi:hypothetical protein